jgi:PHP family Zn ribbon phosphoesterase
MINILKGRIFGKKDFMSFSFIFRKEHFYIENLQKINGDPFEACILDKENAIKLIEWLNMVLKKNETCDECYDYKLPDNFSGEIVCLKCNNIIKKI